MSKWYLFSKLAQKGNETCTIRAYDGQYYDGVVESVERKDDSGQSFHVKIWQGHFGRDWRAITVLVTTVD
jgi:hypothetical protein